MKLLAICLSAILFVLTGCAAYPVQQLSIAIWGSISVSLRKTDSAARRHV
jgi:hypothetical protein